MLATKITQSHLIVNCMLKNIYNFSLRISLICVIKCLKIITSF